MFNFFLQELEVLYFRLEGWLPVFTVEGAAPCSYIFFYLIFLSVTPVFYISPTKEASLYREHYLLMFLVYGLSLLYLLSNNMFYFVLFYESIIIPVFFVLRGYSHYYRRTQAAFFILIWAMLGSFFLLVGVMLLSFWGNTSFFGVVDMPMVYAEAAVLLLVVGFSVKAPLWPFHYWISRAHAEGPTNMSIFLSGVLVKLSVFGILRVLDFFFFKVSLSLLYYLALVGVVDATLKMVIQIDSKVVVAFSTTVQMNFLLFILFSRGGYGDLPLAVGLVNHLLTATLLFFTCDVLLVRLNTREFFFLSGLYYHLPVFSFFLLFTAVNQINFPGFIGFILDITFLSSVVPEGASSGFFLFFFLFVLEHLYIFFFFLKIAFGVSNKLNFFFVRDLGFNENSLYVYLLSVSVFFGVFPSQIYEFFFLSY